MVSEKIYYGVVVLAALAIFAPAAAAGFGFLIAIGAIVLLLLVAIGGPKFWELYVSKSMGERGSTDVRDLVGGNDRLDDGKRGGDQ